MSNDPTAGTVSQRNTHPHPRIELQLSLCLRVICGKAQGSEVAKCLKKLALKLA